MGDNKKIKSKITYARLVELFHRAIQEVKDAGIEVGIIKEPEIDKNIFKKLNKIALIDGIKDAGNLGTIIRTANAFGIYNIVCSKGTTDSYAPKVVRSTMLGIVKSNIIYSENIIDFILNLNR